MSKLGDMIKKNIEVHFLERNVLYFDLNFIEVC